MARKRRDKRETGAPIDLALARLLKAQRLQAGVSQTAAGAAAGLSQSRVTRIEAGLESPVTPAEAAALQAYYAQVVAEMVAHGKAVEPLDDILAILDAEAADQEAVAHAQHVSAAEDAARPLSYWEGMLDMSNMHLERLLRDQQTMAYRMRRAAALQELSADSPASATRLPAIPPRLDRGLSAPSPPNDEPDENAASR